MKVLIFSIIMILAGMPASGQLNVLSSAELDSSALNFSSASASFNQNVNGRSYQRSPLSTFKGYQYATYYDGNRNVCVARRKLPAEAWEVIRFTDYEITNHDSHNVVALGICEGDGTIHVAFDHHKHPLNYRVSSAGVATNPESVIWSASLFGSITDRLGNLGRLTDVTYPSFFSAPDGNMMFYYRNGGSGSGDGMIHEYQASIGQWTTGMGKFISRSGSYSGAVSSNNTTRNPYINGISYGGNRLHVTWGWREKSGGTQYNHDLMYSYSDDDGRTWKNTNGSQIGRTSTSAISVNSTSLVVGSIPEDSGLSNQFTHYAYPDGRCHVMLTHRLSGSSTVRYHHYWRKAGGGWSSEALSFSGSRPKLVGDDNGELFLAYESGNRLRVAKGTPNAARTAWSWSLIHSQSDRSEGGEGHIDIGRWESERVLSVYGQEDGGSVGSPSALSVFDYQVSGKAILPEPLSLGSDVSLMPSLSWNAGIDAVSHRVYLGTDGSALASATPASAEFKGQQNGVIFSPSLALMPSTTYFWRVDEIDDDSEVHQGIVWSFNTEENDPPTITELLSPTIELGETVPNVVFAIGDDFTNPADLVISKSSSNPGLLPESGIEINGTGASRLLRLTPTDGVVGVSEVTILVSDGFSITSETFVLTVTAAGPTYSIYSDSNDASVRETPNVVDETKMTTLLGTGGVSPQVDRCTVYVFQLPDYGSVISPFSAASLTFHYEAKQNDLQDNDLYGLGSRILPEVLANDYYGQTSVEDSSDATRLQANILDNETALGLISTSAGGSAALGDYLNAEYDSGLGAGKFVFLRLNTAGAKDGIDRATLTMSEGGSVSPIDTRPRLEFNLRAVSQQAEWRDTHFGNPFSTGIGVDGADPNSDGENNLLEFATGQDPLDQSRVTATAKINGSKIELRYTRSKAALADGVTFIAEWSDTLLANSWSDFGFKTSVENEDAETEDVVAEVFAGGSKRFVRFKVTSTNDYIE